MKKSYNGVTELFYNNGLKINPIKSNQRISSLNKYKIIKEFKSKGFILFRNFKTNINEITNFIDFFSKSYSNDAIRRKIRFKKNNIRSVDAGTQKIELHSEASFSPNCPSIIWFYCINPPKNNFKERTTVCDGINLWENLSPQSKSFFLGNLVNYKLKIPVNIKKKNLKKKWYLPFPGVKNCEIDYNKGTINFEYLKFAVNLNEANEKLAFSNHLLVPMVSEPQLLSRNFTNGKKLSSQIKSEINKLKKKFTYFHSWNKNDLLMIDNKRFMHGREKVYKYSLRDIVNVQALKTKF